MQQTNGVAVLATHLAHTDHRALSQAWYSALHLADQTAPPPRARTVSAAASRAQHGAPSAGAGGRPSHRAAAFAQAPSAPGARGLTRDGHVAPERRDPRSIARQIERSAGRRVPRAGAASFTIHAAGGRVHLVVRSDGDRTRVVAVCAPPLRERVERALAHVRFALAGSGVRAEVA